MNYATPSSLFFIDHGKRALTVKPMATSTRTPLDDQYRVEYVGNENLHLRGQNVVEMAPFPATREETIPSIWRRVNSRFLEDHRFISLIGRISDFRKLKDGWDANEAIAPSTTAIHASIGLVYLLRKSKMLPSSARASSDGSIILDIARAEDRHFFEIFEDGVVLVERAGTDNEEVSDVDPSTLPEVLARLA